MQLKNAGKCLFIITRKRKNKGNKKKPLMKATRQENRIQALLKKTKGINSIGAIGWVVKRVGHCKCVSTSEIHALL